MNVCEAYPFFCFSLLLMNKKNVTLKRVCQCCNENWEKESVLEDNVFIENTCLGIDSKKRKTKFTRRSSFKQDTWFSWPMVSLRLNMCASAMFVVRTSGILPKLNYRSVKSYTFHLARILRKLGVFLFSVFSASI